MARFLCKCGETLSTVVSPNNIELIVYTDEEWDNILNQDNIDPLSIPQPKYDVWRCPKCERVYVFSEENDKPIKIYTLEND